MATKKKAPDAPVRKSFLVIGGSAIGAALFGFILFNFVLGGGDGGGTETTTAELATLNNATIPIATEASPEPGSDGAVKNELTPGGRDPFIKPSGIATTDSNPGGLNSTSGVSAAAPPVGESAPTTTYAAPAPQPVPVGEGPAPEQTQPAPAPTPAPQATPRPVYPKQTITVLSIYSGSADVRIDDTVYEGVRADQKITDRFNLDEFEGSCFWMKDRYPRDSEKPQRFKLCADDTVTR